MQHHLFGCAPSHHLTACIAAFRAQINQPVRGTNHVQVVLDHQQRMPRIDQLAQRPHQLGDVVKVQAGGGFVQHEQGAAPRQRLTAGAAALGSLGQKTGQLQALRLAAGQGGHGLAQLDVFQTHVHDGLQGSDDIPVTGKCDCGFTDGQIQYVGDVQACTLALNHHLQNLRPVALAITVRAAQVHIA